MKMREGEKPGYNSFLEQKQPTMKLVHAFPSSRENQPEVSTLALKKGIETRFALRVIFLQASSSILDKPFQKWGSCH